MRTTAYTHVLRTVNTQHHSSAATPTGPYDMSSCDTSGVGRSAGARVGFGTGKPVGMGVVGWLVGRGVLGAGVGIGVGSGLGGVSVGLELVGEWEGWRVIVGTKVGLEEGSGLGTRVGGKLGSGDGLWETVGSREMVGADVGAGDGKVSSSINMVSHAPPRLLPSVLE